MARPASMSRSEYLPPTEARKVSTTIWNHTQLMGGYSSPITVSNHAMSCSWTRCGSLSQSMSRVRARPTASEAASTFAWPSSPGVGQRSGLAGLVPASSPLAYQSAIQPVPPGSPAIRKEASRNVRANASRESLRGP